MKSTPLFEEMEEEGGYAQLLAGTFLPALTEASRRVPGGGLAIIYDKNPMETWGYACALANLTDEEVHLVPMMQKSGKGASTRVRVRFEDGIMMVDKSPSGQGQQQWIAIRAGE